MRSFFCRTTLVLTPVLATVLLFYSNLKAEEKKPSDVKDATVIQATTVDVKDNYKGLMPEGLWRIGDGILFPSFALVVDKSKKKIHVIDNSTGTPVVAETYDADLGKMSGDKLVSGDARTPEGIYFLQKSLEGSTLDPFKYGVRAFTTDYPNIFDQRLGKTGYGIWLHAIDESQTLERGSHGCVVVRNDTIKKLAKNITLRETPLMIFDKVQWVPNETTKKQAEPVLDVVSRWRKAWESKDMETYMSFYPEYFKFGKMKRDVFKRFKEGLAQKYENIKVTLSMPVIYSHKDYVVVRFFQDYSSSAHTDFGEKTLYMVKDDNGYKILNETWQESTNPQAKSYLAGGTSLCCTVSH